MELKGINVKINGIIFICVFVLFTYSKVYAQKDNNSTNVLLVTGKVRAEKKFLMSSIMQMPSVELRDVNVSCSPRKEDKVPLVKAVPIRQLLDSVQFDYERAHDLGRYYFIFEAADGYKIVFSFNELYNTDIGNAVYIVTELDGKKVIETGKQIMLLCTKDIKSGSRNLKWLTAIKIACAN